MRSELSTATTGSTRRWWDHSDAWSNEMDLDTTKAPKTREVLLEGLRQALQARVGTIWNNVTLAGEPSPGPRFAEGIKKAIEYYEKAWKHIDEMMKSGGSHVT